jgi:1-acyl-sn-glycerol-3-phosphate acyltransferase
MTVVVMDFLRKIQGLPSFMDVPRLWRAKAASALAPVTRFRFNGVSMPKWRQYWGIEPFFRLVAKYACIAVYDPKYTDFDQIPETGGAILISNHVSYADGLIIASGCNRPVRFVIDTLIYELPVVNFFMRHNRAIPILPTRESVTHALNEISEGLRAGDLICIFPEGQLTYTGGLGRFKTGIESILKRDPVPVYPIALTGLWGSMYSRKYLGSIYRFIPKRFSPRVQAICGAAIPGDQATINRLQEAVMRLKYKGSPTSYQ